MTPQERELITNLFDRVAPLESAPRDPEAERTIAEGLQRAPHAIYPLVQTVLVQDEALKAANAKIEELQAALGEPAPEQRPQGFLDNMRESLFGRRDTPPPHAGSVPSVRPGGSPWGNAPGYRDPGPAPMAPPPGYGGGYGGGGYGGGSFLGTAAASAAGMIGGSLLLGGIRNMLGGHSGQGAFAGTFDHLSGGGGSPWSGGGGSGDLARQAGLDDIGRSPGGGGAEPRSAGLFGDGEGDDQGGYGGDQDGQDGEADDGDFGGDMGGGDGGSDE
jgi:uncharacterized protein